MKTLYQTKDGKTFSDEKIALDWEKSLEIKKEYEIKVRALGYITDIIEAETEEEAEKLADENYSDYNWSDVDGTLNTEICFGETEEVIEE